MPSKSKAVYCMFVTKSEHINARISVTIKISITDFYLVEFINFQSFLCQCWTWKNLVNIIIIVSSWFSSFFLLNNILSVASSLVQEISFQWQPSNSHRGYQRSMQDLIATSWNKIHQHYLKVVSQVPWVHLIPEACRTHVN